MSNFQKIHVGSGSFQVGKKGDTILQAFLGTCVGIAIFDPKAGVGGIIHLLLPQPISSAAPESPEKYATTGIPLFLKALYKEGAQPEKLKACIAGGALVGPVNEQDISLDIGGRTADAAKEILTREKIQIETSETGGFFTCCLNLNMSTWESSITPSIDLSTMVDSTAQRPAPEDIKDAMEKLQPIPQVAIKILRLINEDKYNIGKIAEEVGKDQVITAKTLKLCNSGLFVGRKRIDTLEEGILILGQHNLVKLILSTCIKGFFSQTSSSYSLCKGDLYHHAVGTAIIAEMLAKITEKVPPATAYTAGLVHDIGKVLLDQFMTSLSPMFYRKLRDNGKDILTIEEETFGTNHTKAGTALAKMWKLPSTIVEAVEHHHTSGNLRVNMQLANIVRLSDTIMSMFGSDIEQSNICSEELDKILKSIDLNQTGLLKIIDMIPASALSSNPELAIVDI